MNIFGYNKNDHFCFVNQKIPLRNGKAIHIVGGGTCNKKIIFKICKECLWMTKEVWQKIGQESWTDRK